MTPASVSIIIVSFNTRDHLARCLAAIPASARDVSFETIVVDNGSTDGTQAMVAREFPEVRLIQSRENLGFGRANNLGARTAAGSMLLLLNSDCEPQPGALGLMHEALSQDASLGGVFCRLLNSDGSLQPSVHQRFPSPWSVAGELFFLSRLRYAVYRNARLHPWLLRSAIRAHSLAHDVAWGGAACLLIRRQAFEAVGGFDEAFHIYCEDTDLCKRVREAGYRLRYLPAASAVHHWGQSTAQMPGAMMGEAYRSRLRYFDKHFPGWGGAAARAFSTAELSLRRAVFALLGRLPSRHQHALRDRAAASAACLHGLRRAGDATAVGAPAAGTGFLLPFLALVVFFSLFRYVHGQAKLLMEAPFIDFAHYYTYALIVAHGRNPFDPEAVAWADALLNVRRAGAAANYPPLFYLFMQPWALLPFRTAAHAWFWTGQLCIAGSLALCFRRADSLSPVRMAAVFFVVLNFQPLLESMALGQSNPVLLILVTLAWVGLRTGRPWLTGGAVALALHIKIQYAILLPLLWWMGQRRAALCGLFLAGLGVATSLATLGPAHYLDYLGYLWSPPPYLHTWTANLSPRATLFRTLSPLRDGQVVASVLTAGLDCILVYVFARAVRLSSSSPSLDWAWCLGLTAVPLLSPLTEEHHLVVLLLPVTLLLLASSSPPGERPSGTHLIGSILLLGGRYSLEQFPAFQHGPLSLLAAGKILGVAGLAWVLVRQLDRGRRETP